MHIEYFSETDTLYISLVNTPSVESQEIAPNVVADFDEKGRLVGIEVDPVKDLVDLSCLEARGLPFINLQLSREVATAR